MGSGVGRRLGPPEALILIGSCLFIFALWLSAYLEADIRWLSLPAGLDVHCQLPPRPITRVRFFSGGGGLYSTAGDYVKFMRMILNSGKLGNARILKSETISLMTRNQLGDLNLRELKSLAPLLATDPIRLPGSLDKFGLGFGINSKPVEGGRAAGSLSWAGIFNTYFWIDPSQKTCAVFMAQSLPFADSATISLFEQFEHAVYAERGAR